MQTQEQKDNYRCVEILHKEHDFPFEGFEIVNAMKEFGKECRDKAIDETVKSCAEAAKTIKSGNSGSWLDASVDKQSILSVADKLKTKP